MWLYIPQQYLVSAPEPGDSTSASVWRSEMLASSAALNTKQVPWQSWQRVWKREGWMRHLYGLISTPSTADLGVASWMESLAATRASRSASPGSSLEPMTPGISGPPLPASSQKSSPTGSSLKTWQDTFGSDISTSSNPSLDSLVSAVRKAYTQRVKSGRPTGGSGSSSSGWPTPRREDGECAGNHPGNIDSLTGATRYWPTATAHDGRRPGPDSSSTQNANLKREAELWPTPRTVTGGAESAERRKELGRTSGGGDLQAAAQTWATPSANNFEQSPEKMEERREREKEKGRNGNGFGLTLGMQVGQWQTPATDSFRSRGGERKDEQGLDQQARSLAGAWATPAARSVKGGYSPEALTRKDGKSRMDLLDNQAIYHGSQLESSPQDPETLESGADSSSSTRTSPRQLNPRFVEWLMGWPVGWTSLAPLSSVSRATGLFPSKRPSPSAISGDNWPTPDTQNSRAGGMRSEAKGKHAMSLHHVVAQLDFDGLLAGG